MKSGFVATVAVSLLALAGLIALLYMGGDSGPLPNGNGDGEAHRLVFYCAAGIKPPMSTVLDDYEKEFGVEFQTIYAGSGALLSQIRVGEGDLYLAADATYLHDARDKGLVREIIPLARQRPVIAVRRDNPHNIQGLSDLTREDVRLSLALPEVAAISKVARRKLGEDWAPLAEHMTVQRSTVNEVANDVKLETADAGIVWDATASQYPELEIVRVPELEVGPNQITLGVLSSSKQPTRALHFARYVSSRDKGLKSFEKLGYEVVHGDKWPEGNKKPEIHLFAGGLNKPAVEQTIAEFQKREGCTVLTTYNGCGVLVGQMKAGERPDLYFACDVTFMDQVHNRDLDLFVGPANVSRTDMVIITEKGNPHGIERLEDLQQAGLKLALCNPKLSALGALTDALLDRHGIREGVRANEQMSSATADRCVEAVVVGRLDAAIVYRANTTLQRDNLEVISIDDPSANAIQPIAVGRESDYPLLTGRLKEAIMSAESKHRFDELGFEWLVE